MNYENKVWFKTDLRLYDNEALVQSHAQGEKVLPVLL
jgi:deoxyribodipyrimidine photo-lyase